MDIHLQDLGAPSGEDEDHDRRWVQEGVELDENNKNKSSAGTL
jgi:hypothetical protein